MGIKGKVAIVTGAAKGIGCAISERLASEGVVVAAVDIEKSTETVKSITDAGGRAAAFVADVSKPDDVAATVDAVVRELGPVAILVNNAGLHPNPPTPLVDMPFDLWRRMISVDLDSMFLFSKAVVPQMQKAKWGRIINFSSAVVDAIVPPGAAHYIAAKAGAVGLTRALATELGDYFITVNAVAPGTVETPGIAGVDPSGELLRIASGFQTIKVVTQPKHIAAAVAYLVSDDAELVTGQVIHVDGGTTRT